jgi:hypothetical protein
MSLTVYALRLNAFGGLLTDTSGGRPPNAGKLTRMVRIVLQVPLADALELLAPDVGSGSNCSKTSSKAGCLIR